MWFQYLHLFYSKVSNKVWKDCKWVTMIRLRSQFVGKRGDCKRFIPDIQTVFVIHWDTEQRTLLEAVLKKIIN